MDKYEEDFFYSDDGWPPEEFIYCKYPLPVIGEECGESDYDQFALVVNSVYPYLRLARNRGRNRYPCGLNLSPSTDGFFAKKIDKEGRKEAIMNFFKDYDEMILKRKKNIRIT